MLKTIRSVALCTAIIFSTANADATQFTTDQTDLYWNPKESGWGMQVVQEADIIFVTMYVYDTSGNPIWYVATGSYLGNYVWTGDLYQTTGPWFGAAVFDPASVTVTKVGTLTFNSTSVYDATVSYSVNGVAVTKNVERQTLKNDNYGGTYVGQFKNVQTCSDAAQSGTFNIPVSLVIAHGGGSVFSMVTIGSSATCNFSGTYTQHGRFGSVDSGTYFCSDGTMGTFRFFEMYVNISGFTGRATLQNSSCSVTASHFGGMRQ